MTKAAAAPTGASLPGHENPGPEAHPIDTVAVIGAGNAGREFALRCIAAGFHVVLEDVMPAKLRNAEQAYSELNASSGTLRLALTVEDAVREADLAIDFVPDELESKLEIFCMVDRMAPPRTVLLTPTETLSISDLASCTYRPDRCFALRGGVGCSTPTRLISARGAAPRIASEVQTFLSRMALQVSPETDSDDPMLVKNYL